MKYDKNTYGRRLSRMTKEDRLLSRAINRTKHLAKPKFQRVIEADKDEDTYDITSEQDRARGKKVESKSLPKEWR